MELNQELLNKLNTFNLAQKKDEVELALNTLLALYDGWVIAGMSRESFVKMLMNVLIGEV